MDVDESPKQLEESVDLETGDDAVVLGDEDLSGFNQDNILPQPQEDVAKSRSWLQPTDYDSKDSEFEKHRTSRADGTCQWLLNSGTYKLWESVNNDRLLWVSGIPGSGKSVAAAMLVDQFRKKGTPVLYFFFRQIIDANNTAAAALRDWLDQVIGYSPPLQVILVEYVKSHRSLESVSMADLWLHLRTALSHLPHVIIVADALDEMNDGEAPEFIRELSLLAQWKPACIKVVILSRPVPRFQVLLLRAKALELGLDECNVDLDIIKYVNSHLETSKIPPQYHSAIRGAVPGRANGLFLYAKLAMDSLTRAEKDIQEVLNNLPLDLNVMYTDLLKQTSTRSGMSLETQVLIMRFVTHASYPLRLLELSQVIHIQPGRDECDLKSSKNLVRSAGGSLLEILPTEMVCVVHHSLTEFLTGAVRDSAPHSYPILEFGDSHKQLALICLSYLRSDGLKYLERDLNTFNSKSVWRATKDMTAFTRYAGSNWFVHARKATSSGVTQSELWNMLDTLFTGENLEKLVTITSKVHRRTTPTTPLFASVALGIDDYAKRLLERPGIETGMVGDMEIGPLAYAAKMGYTEMVKLLLQHGASTEELSKDMFISQAPLHFAAGNNHSEIVTLLLEAGADAHRPAVNRDGSLRGGGNDWSALETACTRGHIETVSAFLPFIKDSKYINRAMAWAADRSRSDIVALLAQNPLFQINRKVRGCTPLMRASACHDPKAVKCLLAAGADSNGTPAYDDISQDYSTSHEVESNDSDSDLEWYDAAYQKPIETCSAMHSWAASATDPAYGPLRHEPRENSDQRTEECFKLLIDAGCDIHQQDANGDTPLHVATSLITARLLVEAGADINAVNFAGDTSLTPKIFHQDQAVVEYLLQTAARTVSTQSDSRTIAPLLQFLQKQKWQSALLFLKYGADATVVDKSGNGVFHSIADLESHHKNNICPLLIESFCKAGANVNMRNYKGETILHTLGRGESAAFGRSHVDQASLLALLETGADVNARDNQGQTPLYRFVSNSPYTSGAPTELLQMLVEAGASPGLQDYNGRNLLFAVAQGSYHDRQDCVWDWILSKGVDPAATDNDGNTLFHSSILHCGHGLYPEKLLGLGVDILRANNYGRTPLHSISAQGQFDDEDEGFSFPRPAKGNSSEFEKILALYEGKDVNLSDSSGVTPLHLAATFSAYQCHLLLKAGADPLLATHEGLTALHLAARGRQPNVIGLLLDSMEARLDSVTKKRVMDRPDSNHRTALYYACASGISESVRLLVESGANVDLNNAFLGCANFELEEENWLRANISHQKPFGRYSKERNGAGSVTLDGQLRATFCRRADYPVSRLDDMVAFLIAYSPSAKTLDRAIKEAAGNSADYTVDRLLRLRHEMGYNNIDPFDWDRKSHASFTRREAVRRAYSCEIPELAAVKEFPSQFTFLMSERYYDLVQSFLSREDCRTTESDGETRLHHLASRGFASLLRLTLTSLMQAYSQDSKTHSVLRHETDGLLRAACTRNMPNMEVIKVLVDEFEVDMNQQGPHDDSKGSMENRDLPDTESALHILSRGAHWWQNALAIPYLVHRGASLELRDSAGMTPLNAALKSFNREPAVSQRSFEKLIQLGSDVNAVDNDGISCLTRAIRHLDIMKLLLAQGATVGSKELSVAIQSGIYETVELLLQHRADPNGRSNATNNHISDTGHHYRQRPADEMYPLHLAAVHLRYVRTESEIARKVIRLLLDYGADPNLSYEDATIAHSVMNIPVAYQEIIQLPSLDIEAVDNTGATLFLLACSSADPSMAELLMKRGANIFARDRAERNALHILFDTHNTHETDELFGRLASEEALINSMDDKGRTPLHAALSSRSRNAEHVRMLLSAGGSPWLVDLQGNNSLHIFLSSSSACCYSNGLLKALLEFPGADECVNARNEKGQTPVFAYFIARHSYSHVETPEGYWEDVSTLLRVLESAGVDWTVVDEQRQTMLHVVANNNHVRHFKFLMGKGLDPMAENEAQETTLDIAAKVGADDILELFESELGSEWDRKAKEARTKRFDAFRNDTLGFSEEGLFD